MVHDENPRFSLAGMSDIWVCNICQQAMPVSHCPYHLIQDSHMERLIVGHSLIGSDQNPVNRESSSCS
ncbi:hypothetical protein DM02DRAFT_665294 [Periconia macrospinosa]|uniref:Uncharacterized protein n=1 Tax=Periconia macrospinosa TaxID=97972 RepID=A0A2V1CX06_9PLEO|nr:hypothetical protein DM02DRAFT_665294 [Periconia macrospinosa]